MTASKTSAVAASAKSPRARAPKVALDTVTLSTADLSALIAKAVADAIAVMAPVAVAPVAPVAPAAPALPAFLRAPAVVAPVAPATPAQPQWNAFAFVGKVEDRLTPSGKPELCLHIVQDGKWVYPAAYQGVRAAMVNLGLQVGDGVALTGFVSSNTAASGRVFVKRVIRTCAVTSRKADRAAAQAAAGATTEVVASAAPATPALQAILASATSSAPVAPVNPTLAGLGEATDCAF